MLFNLLIFDEIRSMTRIHSEIHGRKI